MDKYSSLIFSQYESNKLENIKDNSLNEFTDTCKSCGSSSFEIKSEHGVTYQHCAYCGRDTIIKTEINKVDEPPVKEQSFGELIARWEKEEPLLEYDDYKIKKLNLFKRSLNKEISTKCLGN